MKQFLRLQNPVSEAGTISPADAAIDKLLTKTDYERTQIDPAPPTGWFCLRIDPWVCEGCRHWFLYHMYEPETGGHLVVVWPQEDDPTMLKLAERLRQEGDGAKVVEYKLLMGKHISFYALPSGARE